MHRLRHLWRTHRLAFLAFLVVLAITLVLAVRSIAFVIYWSDPTHRDQIVEGWMTPRYVAHSWKVPPEVVRAALAETALPGRGQTLADIAKARGVPLEDIIVAVEAEIARHRASIAQ